MNKLLKTTGIFILGIGLMTGCTDKVAQKIENKNNDNITSEVKTTEETPTSFCRLAKEVGVSSVVVTLLVRLLLLLSIFCATLSVQPVISPIPKINIPVVFRSLFILSTFFCITSLYLYYTS